MNTDSEMSRLHLFHSVPAGHTSEHAKDTGKAC